MKWISVTERLPDNMDDTLLKATDAPHPIAGWYQTSIGGRPIFYGYAANYPAIAIKNVTHWLELTN